MNTENSSGYSSIKTSPQSSDEDLLKYERWNKIRLELKPRNPLKTDVDTEVLEEVGESSKAIELIEEKTMDEEECDFRPVCIPNELDIHKDWYDKLLIFRIEYKRGERGAFPPFPPPPLPSALIAASRAVSYNAFDAVKRAATKLSLQSKSPSTAAIEMRAHRFMPSDFQPLPPPHVYLEMIKTLAPHQYVDLTYALAGAVLLDMGVKVPDHYPPLPPKIEPFRDLEAEERAHLTEMSSQSSSEGEYSDASEHSKFIERLKRRKNRERRAAREVRIAAKNLNASQQTRVNDADEMKKETFSRESVYKEKTLTAFIPRRINRRPPIPFLCPPRFHRGPLLPPPFPPPPSMFHPFPFPVPLDYPKDRPMMYPPIPLCVLSPPETPSSSTISLNKKKEETSTDKTVSQKNMSTIQLQLRDKE